MSEKEYLQKVALANEWMSAYYEKDAPLASDEEYDALIRELRAFESANPSLVSKKSRPAFKANFTSCNTLRKCGLWRMSLMKMS